MDTFQWRLSTAFKTAPNEYITAYHCVIDKDGQPIQELTLLSPKADLAYFSVRGYNSEVSLELSNASDMNSNISIYSFVDGRLVTDKNCRFVKQDINSGLMIHECDTVPGASGSPIIFDGKVIGIHLGAISTQEKTENVACQFSSAAKNRCDYCKLRGRTLQMVSTQSFAPSASLTLSYTPFTYSTTTYSRCYYS